MRLLIMFVSLFVGVIVAANVSADELSDMAADPLDCLFASDSTEAGTVFTSTVTVEPAEPVDPSYYTLTAPLDQDGFAIDEPAAADAEDVWITEAYWTTECVGGVCRPVQRFRRVARQAASTALDVVTLDGVVLQQQPARRFVGRVFTNRPLRTWWANRPRLFGRCR